MKHFKLIFGAVLVAFASLLSSESRAEESGPAVRNVVLVHGAAMDGSSWRKVYDILVSKHYHVTVVQLPLTGLEADVAVTSEVLARQDGPVVLVGHSYGGAVIGQAGTDPKVKSLVYVAAIQPDVGETVADLNSKWPMPSHIVMVDQTSMIINPENFAQDVAADLPASDAAFLAASQTPTAVTAFGAKIAAAAWRSKPSFGIIATEDKTLSPTMLRSLYGRAGTRYREVSASHVVHMTKPDSVAAVIIEASASHLE
jgi:pimeloyl-ACP methyl ester carboxylesterase